MKKRIKKKTIIIVVVIIAIGALAILGGRKGGNTPVVSTVKAHKGNVESTLISTGTVKSEEVVTYYAITTAKVDKINVEEGDIVKAGDVLITYDEKDILMAISANDLELLSTDANYKATMNDNSTNKGLYADSSAKVEELNAKISAQEQYIKGLQDGIDSERRKKSEELTRELETQELYLISIKEEMNKAGRELSNDDINYYNKLIDGANIRITQITTQQKLLDNYKASDNKEELLELANKDLKTLREELEEAKANKAKSDAAILNSYKVNALKASNDLNTLKLYNAGEKLQKARNGVISETDGIVTKIEVSKGAGVTEGTALIVVESIEKVMVTFGASKYDLEKLRENQKVDIVIAGAEYEGIISKIDHMASGTNSNGSATVNVKVHVVNPDENIYLGIDGKLTIHVAEVEGVIIVPVEAVNTNKTGDFVYQVKDGKIVTTYVKTGISSNSDIEILEGVSEGDEVVTLVTTELRDGMKVQTSLEK